MCRHEGKKEIELAYPFVYSIQRTAGCSIVLDDVTEWIDKKIEIEREREQRECVCVCTAVEKKQGIVEVITHKDTIEKKEKELMWHR